MKQIYNRYRYSLILLKELVKTDFKLRYQGSLLGIAWSVVKPLLLFVVMYFVFVKFLKFTDGTPSYPIVLLLGITLWGFFSEATSVGMNSIVGRGDILRKINFPRYIVVVSSSVSAMISLAINLVVVFVFMIATGVEMTWLVLLLPLSILQLYILALGVSFILATLYVKFRDIGHIWEVLSQLLFYAMPIFYPLSFVAASFPVVAQFMLFNPLAQTIQDARHNFISPETVPTIWNTASDVWLGLIPVVLTIVIFIVGVIYFRKNSRKFAEEL